ncbi:MAG: hypothetical protein HC850_08405, partial [Rhodomicrobium sp.]|nr:hypothetical protein [Rhodomicrobium sp.]
MAFTQRRITSTIWRSRKKRAPSGCGRFLITEIMFFGGLFLAYTLFRAKYAESFAAASSHLKWEIGAANTVVLIVSSLTMAMSVYYAQTSHKRKLILMLVLTMILGATFLVV